MHGNKNTLYVNMCVCVMFCGKLLDWKKNRKWEVFMNGKNINITIIIFQLSYIIALVSYFIHLVSWLLPNNSAISDILAKNPKPNHQIMISRPFIHIPFQNTHVIRNNNFQRKKKRRDEWSFIMFLFYFSRNEISKLFIIIISSVLYDRRGRRWRHLAKIYGRNWIFWRYDRFGKKERD